jgi:hypothetical protein
MGVEEEIVSVVILKCSVSFLTMSTQLLTIATCCWEKDWRHILLSPSYLKEEQIGRNQYPFHEKLLIINNVSDLELVKKYAQKILSQKILSRVVIAEEIQEEVFAHFKLSRKDFPSDWLFYNALGPLTAIYSAQSEYLLYMTGDVRLKRKVRWIDKALRLMEKNSCYKVANLTWNERYVEAKKESYRRNWNFYFSKEGFSDQMFLIKREDFLAPIYHEIREDASHFPRGDVWEKRVFSYMKNHGWERMTYRWGSYLHENF